MNNPFPYLPGHLQKIVAWMKTKRIPPRIVLLTLGFLATAWFLIRVIPKPSRAAYPCMRATAPFMSGFVLYIIGIGTSTAALKRARTLFSRSDTFLGLIFLAGAILALLFGSIQMPKNLKAARNVSGSGYFTPNDPIGKAKGIFPGRVVWMWNPAATNENCTNTSNNNGIIDPGDDAWFMAKNNNQLVIDSMMEKCLTNLTGKTDISRAWDTLFHYFNADHGNGNAGYTTGQKIFIKINETTAWGGLSDGRFQADLGRTDDTTINDFASETNPFVVLSLLRQLVHHALVPEEMIYVGDPARNIYKEFYDLWHGEFPGVHVLGNNLIHTELDIVSLGRTPVAVTATDKVFFSDHGTVMPDAVSDKLFTIFEEMDYLINVPAMKAHSAAGITLAAKNHFGSFTRQWAMQLHNGLMGNVDDPVRLGYGLYRVQTDIMSHKLLSGKTLLYLVDGLYPGENAGGAPQKWKSIPFNNTWCSSLFMSIDPVAIESVCHDFLRTEYNGPAIADNRPNWYGVDDYLHQAADSSRWPDGIKYDPDTDKVMFASLGVHEHWNDSLNKQYTRNLGSGNGIELIKVHELHPGSTGDLDILNIAVFPDPAETYLCISDPAGRIRSYTLTDMHGRIMTTGTLTHAPLFRITVSGLTPGTYLLRLESGVKEYYRKIVKL
ncbi:MAG: DUF362 domain-containing protein [Bacteroidetes bacterium]|nr:DUF362 domain-containing protein [Bacteroidota bacterium]